MRNRRVLVHGTPFFGRLFTESMGRDGWSFRYHADDGAFNQASLLLDLQACDIVYQICGRVTLGKFLRIAKYLGKKRVVMHWIGSDVLEAQAAVRDGGLEPWLANQAFHWAETPWLVEEVQQLGVQCEMMSLPGARVAKLPSALPQEFSVLVYIPGTQLTTFYGGEPTRVSTFYGLDKILEVAKALPHVDFQMVGVRADEIEDKPQNLRIHGRVKNMTEFYERTTVLWRPVRHDGLSFMVLEALAHARHVLWSYDFPGCTRVATASQALNQILNLYDQHKRGCLRANQQGPGIVARDYAPQQLKTKILNRLEEILES